MIGARIFFFFNFLANMTANLSFPLSFLCCTISSIVRMALFYFYAWNVNMQSAPEAATDHVAFLANRRNEGAEKGRGTM